MNLTNDQITRAFQVWEYYAENGVKFLNKSGEYTDQELDHKRIELIPRISSILDKFIIGELDLGEFKTQIDSINKRNRLWGFMAINGQMFFNMIMKTSQNGKKTQELIQLLKKVLLIPSSISEAKKLIEELEQFVRDLGQYCSDLRGAPKVGSIPYFVSYFWQIQNPEKFPIYYTSMVQAFQDADIWSPSKIVADDYSEFYELNYLLVDKINEKFQKNLKLWDLEHALWLHSQMMNQKKEEKVNMPNIQDLHNEYPIIQPQTVFLPESYIPPVVSILPKLSVNDVELIRICQENGKAIEKVFEDRLNILFGMLGYDTESLGQGHGRVPDGIAISSEFRYAIIYDAKIREHGYNMGTDDRTIREYINNHSQKLRRVGIDTIYFSVISSKFTGDNSNLIRGIKVDTRVNEVILIEVKALMAMLEAKLKNPSITLGAFGIQRLLASSGVLSEATVREFMEL